MSMLHNLTTGPIIQISESQNIITKYNHRDLAVAGKTEIPQAKARLWPTSETRSSMSFWT